MQVSPSGPQGPEDLIREPVDARAIFMNVIKHIAEALPSPSPPRLVDSSLLAWINNKHTLHTCNEIVSR